MSDSASRLIESVRTSIIGDDVAIETPFGTRRVTYADYTASGRSLGFIEDFIRREVMPLYANTHTETSGTGLQTTHFREDARKIIHQAVGGSDDDLVIFCGSGATAAINKVIDILSLRLPTDSTQRDKVLNSTPRDQRPVVFIGPYEHHSNELPWRESLAEVHVIPEDSDGQIDLHALEDALKETMHRPLRIGSFSAASNVTGIGSKTATISNLLHKYDALSFWDFAAAGPYVRIEMNQQEGQPEIENAHKDAVFISPHKFIGGPGTPGILVLKKDLFKSQIPTLPGGGTVTYVTEESQTYHSDPVHREESGTPAIIESIRAGLVFQLKEAVGWNVIREREEAFISRAIERWSNHPNIRILGNESTWRLSIISFVIRCQDKYLHHNFIVALLNDLWGIQARGGCSCAGPYGHRLLGIDLPQAALYEDAVNHGCEALKPGWVRLNFNYFISEETFEYLLHAVEWIASHGHKLLERYELDVSRSIWRHRNWRPESRALRLDEIRYTEGRLDYRSRHANEPSWARETYKQEAEAILTSLGGTSEHASGDSMAQFDTLRWFVLPQDIRGRERPRLESGQDLLV